MPRIKNVSITSEELKKAVEIAKNNPWPIVMSSDNYLPEDDTPEAQKRMFLNTVLPRYIGTRFSVTFRTNYLDGFISSEMDDAIQTASRFVEQKNFPPFTLTPNGMEVPGRKTVSYGKNFQDRLAEMQSDVKKGIKNRDEINYIRNLTSGKTVLDCLNGSKNREDPLFKLRCYNRAKNLYKQQHNFFVRLFPSFFASAKKDKEYLDQLATVVKEKGLDVKLLDSDEALDKYFTKCKNDQKAADIMKAAEERFGTLEDAVMTEDGFAVISDKQAPQPEQKIEEPVENISEMLENDIKNESKDPQDIELDVQEETATLEAGPQQ